MARFVLKLKIMIAQRPSWGFVIRTLVPLALIASIGLAAQSLDLSQAVVVVRPGELPSAETAAATVLIEELEARTGIRLGTTSEWSAEKTVIAITSQGDVPGVGR